jgi:hypothetical protein
MSNPYRTESIAGVAQDEFKALIALSNLKVRALYLQIGGAHVEQCMERLALSMSEGHDSFRRYLAQETADFCARSEDPSIEPPKREKPALSAREALRLSADLMDLLELKRKLALQAVRMANNGIDPAKEFLDAAKESIVREAELAAREVSKAASIPPAPKPVAKPRAEAKVAAPAPAAA